MLLKYINKLVTVCLVTTLFLIISSGVTYAETANSVTVTASILNLRATPDTSSKILKQLKKGNQLNVLENSNGWYKVTSDGLTGWVSGNYVKEIEEQTADVLYGKITGNNVNLRKGPGTSYSVISQLNKGDVLTIIELSANWYKVKTSRGAVGWVSGSYIAVSQTVAEEPESQTVSESVKDSVNESAVSTEASDLTGLQTVIADDFDISELIDYAKSLVGVKYVYGGTTPEEGFDCSGFTKYVFSKYGINLERVAADQAKQGTEISQEELHPGDLIFSDTDGGNNNINHVGIYIGEGKFISATSGAPSAQVTISDLNNAYWQSTYMTARRLI